MSSVSPRDAMLSSKSGGRERKDARTCFEVADKSVGDMATQPVYLRSDTCQDKASVPDDSIILHIHRLRARLGWKTQSPGLQQVPRLSKSDKYKRLIEEQTLMKEDNGEFVYCLPRCHDDPSLRYEPYDLQVVPASTAVQSGMYWTASASRLSKIYMVNGAEIMETVPITEWLHEQQKYYTIKDIRVFSQFRLCKAFTVWKMNVHRSKTDNSRAILLQQLFVVDELFQDCLLYLHSLWEGVVDIRQDNNGRDTPVLLLKVDDSRSYGLKEFCDIQIRQCDKSLARLQTLREKAIHAINFTFLKVAESAGLKDLFLSDSFVKPNYTQLSDWRNLQEKFNRFLKLTDFVFQEMLRYVVTNSVQILVKFLENSHNVTSTEEKKNDQLRSKIRFVNHCTAANKSLNVFFILVLWLTDVLLYCVFYVQFASSVLVIVLILLLGDRMKNWLQSSISLINFPTSAS